MVQCRECGLIFVNPRPNEDLVMLFYPTTYYAWEGGKAWNSEIPIRKKVKRLVRRSRFLSGIARHIPGLKDAAYDVPIAQDIQEWIPPGSVLDVGCGSGWFLDWMPDMGCKTFG